MIVIVAVDDRLGLTFNKRRQSMDQALRLKVRQICDTNPLYMNEYSHGQFAEDEADNFNIIVREDFLSLAAASTVDKFCFVENESLAQYENKIESMIIFKWNRAYPSDMKLDFKPWESSEFSLVFTEDFAGNSHDSITMEIWERGSLIEEV